MIYTFHYAMTYAIILQSLKNCTGDKYAVHGRAGDDLTFPYATPGIETRSHW